MSVLDNKIIVSFEVNGRQTELLTAPNRTVLEVLRENLGLTGVKHGCDDSNCGVCTIIMDGKAVKSCAMLIGQAQGTKITTIEGLETENGLHPLQKAFIEHFAIQCGYCTPGMILSARRCWTKTRMLRRMRSGKRCMATSAAAPATRRSWKPLKRPATR